MHQRWSTSFAREPSLIRYSCEGGEFNARLPIECLSPIFNDDDLPSCFHEEIILGPRRTRNANTISLSDYHPFGEINFVRTSGFPFSRGRRGVFILTEMPHFQSKFKIQNDFKLLASTYSSRA